jgi:N-acetylmuramoyl-L-alanine amidase
MRKIDYIVMHCTATLSTASVEAIKRYWREVLGWKNPGYHYLIEADGETHKLQEEEKPANGVKGYNHNSIHVSYVGGIDAEGNPFDNRTYQQKAALIGQLKFLKRKYPNAIIQGHRDFPGVKKACPSFDAKAEYKMIGFIGNLDPKTEKRV